MPEKPIHLFAVAGSLRKGSFNRMLLREIVAALPEGVTVDAYDGLRDLPHYDTDLESEPLPAAVLALRERVARADGLLIVTPEYNYSIPGVLKNAIDWASRPPGRSALNGKVAGVAGASAGLGGTMRAQYHLRQMLVGNDVLTMNAPEIFVMQATNKFDAEGRLTDETTRAFVGKYAQSLAAFVRRHGKT